MSSYQRKHTKWEKPKEPPYQLQVDGKVVPFPDNLNQCARLEEDIKVSPRYITVCIMQMHNMPVKGSSGAAYRKTYQHEFFVPKEVKDNDSQVLEVSEEDHEKLDTRHMVVFASPDRVVKGITYVSLDDYKTGDFLNLQMWSYTRDYLVITVYTRINKGRAFKIPDSFPGMVPTVAAKWNCDVRTCAELAETTSKVTCCLMGVEVVRLDPLTKAKKGSKIPLRLGVLADKVGGGKVEVAIWRGAAETALPDSTIVNVYDVWWMPYSKTSGLHVNINYPDQVEIVEYKSIVIEGEVQGVSLPASKKQYRVLMFTDRLVNRFIPVDLLNDATKCTSLSEIRALGAFNIKITSKHGQKDMVEITTMPMPPSSPIGSVPSTPSSVASDCSAGNVSMLSTPDNGKADSASSDVTMGNEETQGSDFGPKVLFTKSDDNPLENIDSDVLQSPASPRD